MSDINRRTLLSGLLAVFHVCLGQVPSLGLCPASVKSQPYMEIIPYLGKWYEYQRYRNKFEQSSRCVSFDHKFDDQNVIVVYVSQISSSNQTIVNNATATMVETGKFHVVFPGTPLFDGSHFWVLDTDYRNYAILYSCRNVECSYTELKIQYLWVLTRERHPGNDVIVHAQTAIENQGLPLEELEKTDQSDCPDY